MVAVTGMFFGAPLLLDQKLRLSDTDIRELHHEELKTSKAIAAAIPTGGDAEISLYRSKDAGGLVAGTGAFRMLSISLTGLVGGTAHKFATG